MALNQYFGDAVARNEFNREDVCFTGNWKSKHKEVSVSADDSSGDFDCNICLDSVQDPVVTLCGHLYCWPCIYEWLDLQSISTEDEDARKQQCPVCKAEVSHSTLVPLYGRGQAPNSPSRSKGSHHGKVIPRRPLGPVYGFDMRRSPHAAANLHFSQQIHLNQRHGTRMYSPQQNVHPLSPMLSTSGATSHVLDPMIGVFGEMVYARLFGTSITNLYTYPNSYDYVGSSNSRVRRHMMQADKSLGRICFFLFCCIALCLLLF